MPPSFFMIMLRDVPEAMQRTLWMVLSVFFSATGIRDITKWLMSSLSAAWRRKSLKLLDINSEEWIKDPDIEEQPEPEKMIPAEIGLSYCNKLFYIEKTLKDLPAEERKVKREELETPVWNGFWKWIVTVQPLGGSKL